ncbi:MAG: LCP family protein [Oscillospiraceae bacterium]|nr:LCP family protein [Oscillospiraceae bacterium]
MSRRRNSLKRAALSFLCIVLAVILTAMLSVTLYFQYLLKQINYVEHDETPTLSQEQLNEYLAEEEDSDASAPSMDAGDVEFKDHTTQIGGKGSGLVNILLIGQDRRPGESRARSDTMILCTFNKHTKTLTMTSFLRDLYVEIPGYQDNRINAAYAAGGMSLLNETLKENFGIHIDGNIEVDFNQFAQIVDLLGGVTMELRQDEADVINRDAPGTVSAGTQLLTGQQALAYARIRSLDADGDFSRTNRQRKVISALLDAYKNASLSTVLSLLDDILPMITTDMNDVKIIAYATELFPMLSGADIVSQRIPADGSYSGKMINGMSVLVADMEASRHLLEDTLLN